MMRSQAVGIAAGGAVILLLAVLVYQNFSGQGMMSEEQAVPVVAEAPAEKPVPDNIDDIALEIESETALDTSALDEEVTAENAELEGDSQTLNELSESYDTNSF